jgi:hypothetical protein
MMKGRANTENPFLLRGFSFTLKGSGAELAEWRINIGSRVKEGLDYLDQFNIRHNDA